MTSIGTAALAWRSERRQRGHGGDHDREQRERDERLEGSHPETDHVACRCTWCRRRRVARGHRNADELAATSDLRWIRSSVSYARSLVMRMPSVWRHTRQDAGQDPAEQHEQRRSPRPARRGVPRRAAPRDVVQPTRPSRRRLTLQHVVHGQLRSARAARSRREPGRRRDRLPRQATSIRACVAEQVALPADAASHADAPISCRRWRRA